MRLIQKHTPYYMTLANIDAIKIFADTDGQSCEKEKGIQDLIQDDTELKF